MEYSYQRLSNLIIVFQVTVKNVGDVFLRHSVHCTVYVTHATSYTILFNQMSHFSAVTLVKTVCISKVLKIVVALTSVI